MTEAIIVAIIAGVAAVIGQLIISANSSEKLYAKLDKQFQVNDEKLDAKLEKYQAVTDTKLESLTEEVRKHNAFAERIPRIEERLASASKRIDALENK